MQEDVSKVFLLESMLADKSDEVRVLQSKLARIERLCLEKTYCEHIQKLVNEQIFEIIKEKEQ